MRVALAFALLLLVAPVAEAGIGRGLRDTVKGGGWVMKYECSTDYITETGTGPEPIHYVVEVCANYRWCPKRAPRKCRSAAPWARGHRTTSGSAASRTASR